MSWRDVRASGSAARGSTWHWEWTPERERRQRKRARQGRVRHHSEWECKQCGKCNFMDRTTCRPCARQRQEDDTVIAGETDEYLPGTQPAPKRAPFNSSRAAGGGDHAALKKAEAALAAAQDADLLQSFIDDLAQEVQCRRKRTRTEKTNWCKTGLSLRSNETCQGILGESSHEVPGSRGRRCSGGRHAGQCTRSGESTAGTSPQRMHEGGQRDREQDDGGGAPRGTPQRDRQCREGMAARNPDRSRASRSGGRSKSHAASDKDRQQHAREAAAQDAQETEAQEDREPEDGRGQQWGSRRRQRWLRDLGRRDDAGKGHELQTEQTVRFCDDDGRGLRAAFLRNTVSTCERATSSKDREKESDKLVTTKQSTNTLHNWFQKKQKHLEESSQESIQAHPEARSSNDIDLTQVIAPMTTNAEHIDKAQKIMADEHTMSMGAVEEHSEPMQIDTQEHSAQACIFSKKTIAQHRANITCATCHAARNRGSRMRVCATYGRMHCAQCKPPETKCEAIERTKQGTDEQQEPVAIIQQREREKEKGKSHTSMAMSQETKKG